MRPLVICGVAVALGLSVAAAPAHALNRYRWHGTPGTANMPPVRGWWFYTESPLVRFMPRTVHRSRLNRTSWQRICVEYRGYAFTPGPASWDLDWRRRSCINVRPGYQANFAYSDYRASVPLKAYNVEVWVTWDVGSRRLGSARWDYNSTGDYLCQTPNCYTGYGYGNVAYIMFGL
jgi:hypothetical protein